MIEFCAIASGSNGNCYYVGNNEDAILVDAGISRKQILLRMHEKELDPSKVRAIFISHEHSDHMRGVKILSKTLNVPVYFTKKTFEKSWNPNRPVHYKFFEPGEEIQINSLKVHSFLKLHDAAEPCSFRVELNGKSVGVFTDIGEPCDNLVSHFSVCDAAFLEANYDDDMLWNGDYPYYLKQRVASSNGHLSNHQSSKLFREFANFRLKHLFLSHLSKENNTPEKALIAFSGMHEHCSVLLTHREKPSDVIRIQKTNE